MRIAFRSDASTQIGTGHVMRCLTLADALRERGAECLFICRPHPGHLMDLIVKRGHPAIALPMASTDDMPLLNITDPIHYKWLVADWNIDAADTRCALGRDPVDWMVVDHYALDSRWERAIRQHCRRLMVIDDLADRSHDCDLLLDQNLGRSKEDYADLIPAKSVTLIGPRYALLRPEFAALRSISLARRATPQLKRLLVTMGGVDKNNATGQVLDVLKASALQPELKITVIMGTNAPWLHHVQNQAKQMHWQTQVLVGVSNMADLMEECDLAIGAAGGTSWERCSLGLPSLLLVLAENQQESALALQELGAAIVIQSVDEITYQIAELLAIGGTGRLSHMSIAAAEVTDGCGIEHVIQRMSRQHV